MADTNVAAATAELHIAIVVDCVARYTGTADQLQAEGIIPDDLEWPHATAATKWIAGGLEYHLRRTRPQGHKGPIRTWLALDNWTIEVLSAERSAGRFVHRQLERKAEELRAYAYRHTAAGYAEWVAAYQRHLETLRDKRFQAFKALIPGLVPPKRGRKPKAEPLPATESEHRHG